MQRMLDNLVEAGILRDDEILPLDDISEDDQKPVMELMTSRTFIESHHNPTKFNKDPLTIFRNNTPMFVRKVQRALAVSLSGSISGAPFLTLFVSAGLDRKHVSCEHLIGSRD